MEIEFEIFSEDGKWIGRSELVILEDRTLDGLLEKIRGWVKKRFPRRNVKIVLKNMAGEPRYDIYVPGPARPIRIDPGMFRI